MDEHDDTTPGNAEPPQPMIYEQVVAYLEGGLVPPGYDPAEDPAVFEWQPDQTEPEPVDWVAGNPALWDRRSMAQWMAEEYQAAVKSSSLTRKLSDGVRNRGSGASGARIILDESVLDRLRDAASVLKFELLDWQEDALRQMLGPPAPSAKDVWAQIGTRGPMLIGPSAGASEHAADMFLAAAIWDELPLMPRADPEMLNRVIDDIETDVTAKIARTECPKFPRAE